MPIHAYLHSAKNYVLAARNEHRVDNSQKNQTYHQNP